MKKAARGRPKKSISPADRELVRGLAENGVRQDRIAAKLNISEATLKRRCKRELTEGRLIWEATFEESLAQQVIKPRCNATLKIFMAKVRLGYRENDPDNQRERTFEIKYRETKPGERIAKPKVDEDE